MSHTSLARFTGILLTATVVFGALGLLVSAGATTTAPLETVAVPAGDDLPQHVAAPTTTAPPTTTTVPPTTTTIPPTTTTPPVPVSPVTAPPATAPPATAPPTTAPTPPPPPPAPVAVSNPSMNTCERDTMRWMNEARAAHGTAGLVTDGDIIGIARSWASHLLGIGSLAHNPDYPSQVFDVRPQARAVAENVGRASGSARTVFDSFMGSTGHRNTILDPRFSHAAVGCNIDAAGQHWVVVNFWG